MGAENSVVLLLREETVRMSLASLPSLLSSQPVITATCSHLGLHPHHAAAETLSCQLLMEGEILPPQQPLSPRDLCEHRHQVRWGT